jgi:hypothetical protein
MRPKHDARHRNTNPPAAIGSLADLADIRDVLEVNQIVGLDHAGAHLHQNIGAPGQKPKGSRSGGGNRRGIRKAGWLVVSHDAAPMEKATYRARSHCLPILSNLCQTFKRFDATGLEVSCRKALLMSGDLTKGNRAGFI